MKQKSPLLRIWELGESEHKRLSGAIVSALIGVLGGVIPYIAAAQIIIGMVNTNQELRYYLTWCGVGLAGYVARTLLYSFALALSHQAAFSILKEIRQRVLKKLPKLPLGTVMDTKSGRLKQIIVDQVESMETTLAHLLPEMTSNIIGPICVLIYLFVLDWRMALLSLVSLPVGMVFMMAIMKDYSKDWERAVKTTQEMNETIVEYISGIEVIKAFNQAVWRKFWNAPIQHSSLNIIAISYLFTITATSPDFCVSRWLQEMRFSKAKRSSSLTKCLAAPANCFFQLSLKIKVFQKKQNGLQN